MKSLCDYMIIQRNANGYGTACFCGEAGDDTKTVVARVVSEEDGSVIVPWQKCLLESGKWSVNLTIPEGGLYRAEARATDSDFDPVVNNFDWAQYLAIAKHIGVGDIFILAGQSNMSGYGKEPAYDPPERGVHLYDNSGSWDIACHPLASSVNPIYPNNDGASGTSPGLSFGKCMKKALGVPVGLVMAALGGSMLKSWDPAEDDPFLYKSMLDKYSAVGGCAGIVWYQGCSDTNRDNAATYLDRFTRTVKAWRESFGDVPVVTCQLNRHAFPGADSRFWGIVREAQRNAARTIKDVYVIPTIDLPTCDGIHNTSAANITIGERLAKVLLKNKYGKNGYDSPDIIKAEKISAGTVLLRFAGAHTLRTMDDSACGMNIEDESGLMNCVSCSVCKEGLKVTAEREITGSAVFHAYWETYPPAFFVRDIYGTPMLSVYGLKIENT